MKKYFLILLILILTGCVNNELENTCTKVEKSTELTSTTIYDISFKNDIVNGVTVTNSYESIPNVIDAIKLSTKTQNNFFKDLNFNTLIENDTNYKVEYIIDVNNENEVYSYFNIKKERSKLVNYLKDNGFTCEVRK